MIIVRWLTAFLLVACVARSQTPANNPHSLPPELRNRCALCHTCPTPTKLDPCLITCPRVKESAGIHTPDDGPNLLVMNTMTAQYGPVVFAHRAHAQMAEMSGGCYGCHHYNDTALKILACRTCHPADRKREAVNIPDLKGAYHRQCMDCHRQWSGATECTGCHMQEMKGKPAAAILAGRARRDHPAVPAPGKKVYPTNEQDGTVVTFFHSDHAGRFGLQCADCHRQEGCVRCHDKRPATASKPEPARTDADFETLHVRCATCHADQACTSCHRKTETAAFDHARTSGWPLKSYHAGVACQRCHGDVRKFTRVSDQCQSCHKPWNAASFRHDITGFRLDAAHSTIDCAECHPEQAFGKTPVCSGCHDDKTYPKHKPGKVVVP